MTTPTPNPDPSATTNTYTWTRNKAFDPEKLMKLVRKPIPLKTKLALLFIRRRFACEDDVCIFYKDYKHTRYVLKVWRLKK